MKITADEVKRTADLAMLSVSDDDIKRLTIEMNAVLEYADTLNELDTEQENIF